MTTPVPGLKARKLLQVNITKKADHADAGLENMKIVESNV